jgi:hypothetical protein
MLESACACGCGGPEAQCFFRPSTRSEKVVAVDLNLLRILSDLQHAPKSAPSPVRREVVVEEPWFPNPHG